MFDLIRKKVMSKNRLTIIFLSALFTLPFFTSAQVPDYWPDLGTTPVTDIGSEDPQFISAYKALVGNLPDYYHAPWQTLGVAGSSQTQNAGLTISNYIKETADRMDFSVMYGLEVYINGTRVTDMRDRMDKGNWPNVKVNDVVRIKSVAQNNYSVMAYPPLYQQDPSKKYYAKWNPSGSIRVSDLKCDEYQNGYIDSIPQGIGYATILPLFSQMAFSEKLGVGNTPPSIYVEPIPFANTASFNWLTDPSNISSGRVGSDLSLRVTSDGTLNLHVIFWPIELTGKFFYTAYNVPGYYDYLRSDPYDGVTHITNGPFTGVCLNEIPTSPLFNASAVAHGGTVNDNDYAIDEFPTPKFLSPGGEGQLVFNANSVNDLFCTVDVTKNPVGINESVDFVAMPTGGSGNYLYKWSVAEDPYSVSIGSAKRLTQRFSSFGDKTRVVEVTDALDSSIKTTCRRTVTVANSEPLIVSCSASNVDSRTVIWTASAFRGTGSYTYSWTGEENLSGVTSSVSKTYVYPGPKQAVITVTSGIETVSAICETLVGGPTEQWSFDYSLSNDGNKTVTAGNTVSPIITANLLKGGGYFVDLSVTSIKNSAGTDVKNIARTGINYAFSSNKIQPTSATNLSLQTYGNTPPGVYTVNVSATPSTPPDGFYHCLKSNVESVPGNLQYSKIYYACAPETLNVDEVVALAKTDYSFAEEFIYTDQVELATFLSDTAENIADMICVNHTWDSTSRSPGKFACNDNVYIHDLLGYVKTTSLTVTVNSTLYRSPTLSGYPLTCGNGDIFLSWANPGGNPTGYRVYVNDGDDITTLPANGAPPYPITTGSITYKGTPGALYSFTVKAFYSGGHSSEESNTQSFFAPEACSCRPENTTVIRNVANKWFAENTGSLTLIDPNLYNFQWMITESGSSDVTKNPFTHLGFTTVGTKLINRVRVTNKVTANQKILDCAPAVNVVAPFDYSLTNSGNVTMKQNETKNPANNMYLRAVSGAQKPVSLYVNPPTGVTIDFLPSRDAIPENPKSIATRIITSNAAIPGVYHIKVSSSYTTVTTNDDSTYFDLTIYCQDGTLTCTVPPPTVSAVRPTVREKGKGKIVVSLPPITDPGLTYNIDRELFTSERFNPPPEFVLDQGDQTIFDDFGLVPNTAYKYRAVSLKGGNSSGDVLAENIKASGVGNATMSLYGYQDIVDYSDTTNVSTNFKLVDGINNCTLTSDPIKTGWNNKNFLVQSDAEVNDTPTGDDGSGYKNITGTWPTTPLIENQTLTARCTRVENNVPVLFQSVPVDICVRPQAPQNLKAEIVNSNEVQLEWVRGDLSTPDQQIVINDDDPITVPCYSRACYYTHGSPSPGNNTYKVYSIKDTTVPNCDKSSSSVSVTMPTSYCPTDAYLKVRDPYTMEWSTKDLSWQSLKITKNSTVKIKWGVNEISGTNCALSSDTSYGKSLPSGSSSYCDGEKESGLFTETGQYRVTFKVNASSCDEIVKNLYIEVRDNPFYLETIPDSVNLITVGTAVNNQVKSETAIIKVKLFGGPSFNKDVWISLVGISRTDDASKIVCGTDVDCKFKPEDGKLRSSRYDEGMQISLSPKDKSRPIKEGAYEVLIVGSTEDDPLQKASATVKLNVKNIAPTYEER